MHFCAPNLGRRYWKYNSSSSPSVSPGTIKDASESVGQEGCHVGSISLGEPSNDDHQNDEQLCAGDNGVEDGGAASGKAQEEGTGNDQNGC
jgi:hypothetical protein